MLPSCPGGSSSRPLARTSALRVRWCGEGGGTVSEPPFGHPALCRAQPGSPEPHILQTASFHSLAIGLLCRVEVAAGLPGVPAVEMRAEMKGPSPR